MVRRTLHVLIAVSVGAAIMEAEMALAGDSASTNPLMPGIRSAEINSHEWPRTLHDKQLTGFSPLPLNMIEAPTVAQTIDVGGTYRWIEPVERADGSSSFLIEDGQIRLLDAATGTAVWTSSVSGEFVYWGDLRGAGTPDLLIQQANVLTHISGATGETLWSKPYDPPHVHLRTQVADVFPDRVGLEAAVWTQYGEEGWLLAFGPQGEPEEVWRDTVITNDEWPVRADHGCDIRFDFTDPARPVVWNVRHHRCQSFDARTGEELGRLIYEVGGGIRRNYGPWQFGTDAEGNRYIIVAGEMVQTHVHAIRLDPGSQPVLAWEHYYGEVYVVPGVAVQFIGAMDVDGDGADEVVYNVRDPECEYRSFVRVRNIATGEIEQELADHWCSGHAGGVGQESEHIFYIHPASNGATPEQGPLALVRFREDGVDTLRTLAHGRPWGVTAAPGDRGNDVLAASVEDGRTTVFRFSGTDLESVDPLPELPDTQIQPFTGYSPGSRMFSSGDMVRSWDGSARWRVEATGGPVSTLSGADLDGDGAAELIAHVPNDESRVWTLSEGGIKETLNTPFLGEYARLSPLVYDVDVDGAPEIVVPDASPTGNLLVRAVAASGDDIWRTELPHSTTDDDGKVIAWNAGDFLSSPEGPKPGIAITVYNRRRTMEGTFLLDGSTGKPIWYKDLYRDGNTIRGYRPVGIPGAYDWDGDGAEEIMWDMYSYMAFLRGDGNLAAIYGGPNVNQEDPVQAILLYNSFSPIYRSPHDELPYWFVHVGHGRFGLVGPDPREAIWWEDVGYDTPDRIGFIDADGDSSLEVGYALRNSTRFVCRDLWTGDEKWTIDLPEAPTGPVITADVDGDGRGEFLVDRWCIGVDTNGVGRILWESPVPLGWAVIADFDGDGVGEIACAAHGAIHLLKSTTR